MPGILRRTLERIVEQRPDLVVVTGDLLDVPDDWLTDPEAVPAEAFDQAAEDYRLILDRLEQTGLTWCAIAGNHDWEHPFRRVFGSRPEELRLGGYRFVLFDDHEGEGHLPQRRGLSRERMEACLADADDSPQVHVQHYVIWPVLESSQLIWPYNYADSEQLAERVAGSGRVRLSLSGHFHDGTAMTHLGETAFSVAPALARPPYAWRVYELDGDDVRMREYALEG